MHQYDQDKLIAIIKAQEGIIETQDALISSLKKIIENDEGRLDNHKRIITLLKEKIKVLEAVN